MTAIATPPPAFLEGIDVSGFQADPHTHASMVDWAAVRAAGRFFSLIKASEGNTGRDLAYPSHNEGAGHQGLYTGAYHFGHPDAGLGDPVAEARLFRQAAGEQPLGYTLPPMLDIEVKPVLNAKAAAQWIRDFLAECDQQFQRGDCGIYTNPSFWYWLGEFGQDDRFALRPFWQSQYWLPLRKSPLPNAPKPWKKWDIWQYGGGAATNAGGNAATCPGVIGYADLNLFAGSTDDFLRYIGSAPMTPLPPTQPEAC